MSEQFTSAQAQELVTELERVERAYKFAINAKEVANRLANLLQAEEDAKKRAAEAKAEEEEINALINKNLMKKNDEYDTALKNIEIAKSKANDMIDFAKSKAKEIEDSAREKAYQIKESYQSEFVTLVDEIEKKATALKQLKAEVDAAKSEYEALTSAIAKQKDELKKLLGV